MSYHLTDTTNLKCDKGTAPAPLSVTSQTFMSIEGKLQATDADKKPNENIKPFGVCSITRMSCNPAPTKWQDTSVSEIDGKKELLSTSTCQRSVGGKISVIKSAQNFSVENENSIYEPIAYEREEDESSGSDEEYNDYKLYQNGVITLLKDRKKKIDRLFATDENNMIQGKNSIQLNIPSNKSNSIIGELSMGTIPDNSRYDYLSGSPGQEAYPLGINRARSTNEHDVSRLFIFNANNTIVEWGLAGYEIQGAYVYAIWTGHNIELTPPKITYQGLSKLSFEIHSHPTKPTVSFRSGGSGADVGSAVNIDVNFKSDNYPRHFMYSKVGHHLWEYHEYHGQKAMQFYPGNPNISRPMKIGESIDLKLLRK